MRSRDRYPAPARKHRSRAYKSGGVSSNGGSTRRRSRPRGRAFGLGGRHGAPLNFRWLGAAAAVGSGSMLVLIALGSSIEIIGLATLIAVSALIYLLQRWIVVASSST